MTRFEATAAEAGLSASHHDLSVSRGGPSPRLDSRRA